MLINATRLDTFQKCQRLYFWTSLFDLGGNSPGIRPQYFNDAQKLGEIVHLGLAQYYRKQEVKLYREEALKALDFDALPWDRRNHWLDRLDWVDRLLGEYGKWAAKEDDFEVIDVETAGFVALGEVCWSCNRPHAVEDAPGACPSCNAPIHRLAFITDLLVEREGRLTVIDHKTTKSASAPYLTSWHYSMQLWGYAYGRNKRHQDPLLPPESVTGYGVNILRKLETVGTPAQTHKQCPDCHNGAKKKVTCLTCGAAGTVRKENNPSEQPFQREWESFTPQKAEFFVNSRLKTIWQIENQAELFKIAPEDSYPMNTTHCFTYGVCPMLQLCWGWGLRNPKKWHEPPIEMLHEFDPQPDNYMTPHQLLAEERK